MKRHAHRLKNRVHKVNKKLHTLPNYIKIPLSVLIILLGLVNIINPFINGIFIIIIGSGLLSTGLYDIVKDFRKKRKEKKESQ